jgi:peroxiredoxin
VFLEAGTGVPLMRTLRAGDGFLAQSSKRLLFGLGDASGIDRIVVHWPGGQPETFAAGTVDRHYHLVQGSGIAQPIERPRQIADLTSERLPSSPETGTIQALCFSMIHLPVLDCEDFRQQRTQVLASSARLVLVNLWANWCQPCLAELADFATHEAALRERGIDVVALSVDAVTASNGQAGADEECLQRLKFPFRSGRADRSIVEKLQLLNDNIFELQAPLPIPSSFLVDRQGRVVAVFKGPVTAGELLTHAAKLRVRTTDEWREATLPFPGRWEMPPRQRHLFDLVEQLADRGYFKECQLYVQENQKMLTTHPRWPELSRKINAGVEQE